LSDVNKNHSLILGKKLSICSVVHWWEVSSLTGIYMNVIYLKNMEQVSVPNSRTQSWLYKHYMSFGRMDTHKI